VILLSSDLEENDTNPEQQIVLGTRKPHLLREGRMLCRQSFEMDHQSGNRKALFLERRRRGLGFPSELLQRANEGVNVKEIP